MQLQYETDLTDEEYFSTKAWCDAALAHCPAHPRGGCSFARHGTSLRYTTSGRQAHIARWYCQQAYQTFSMLPDCFASHISGTLDELEQLGMADEKGVSVAESAAAVVRRPCEAASARRWVRARLQLLVTHLIVMVSLHADQFVGCESTVTAMRACLVTDRLLVALRRLSAGQLQMLPTLLGFDRKNLRQMVKSHHQQHEIDVKRPLPIISAKKKRG